MTYLITYIQNYTYVSMANQAKSMLLPKFAMKLIFFLAWQFSENYLSVTLYIFM